MHARVRLHDRQPHLQRGMAQPFGWIRAAPANHEPGLYRGQTDERQHSTARARAGPCAGPWSCASAQISAADPGQGAVGGHVILAASSDASSPRAAAAAASAHDNPQHSVL